MPRAPWTFLGSRPIHFRMMAFGLVCVAREISSSVDCRDDALKYQDVGMIAG